MNDMAELCVSDWHVALDFEWKGEREQEYLSLKKRDILMLKNCLNMLLEADLTHDVNLEDLSARVKKTYLLCTR
jgi:hypothetical protein